MGLPLFEEYLGDDAGDCDAPDEKGELQATAIEGEIRTPAIGLPVLTI